MKKKLKISIVSPEFSNFLGPTDNREYIANLHVIDCWLTGRNLYDETDRQVDARVSGHSLFPFSIADCFHNVLDAVSHNDPGVCTRVEILVGRRIRVL